MRKHIDYCTNCKKNTRYTLQKRTVIKTIRHKEYPFNLTVGICDECGEERDLSWTMPSRNRYEIDMQYRKYENIVSVDDIKKLIRLYRIGKAPLSLALGFGEITITRYLQGQMPSKEYSDIIRSAFTPSFMKEKLEENKDKITLEADQKGMDAIKLLEKIFTISDKMSKTVSYIFKDMGEVGPQMLHKLLYYIQGILYYALYNKPMFEEECLAQINGPVYPKLYYLLQTV